MKSKLVFWTILLGIGGFVFVVWLLEKDENKINCTKMPAAVLASNLDLKRLYEIEKAKKECIEKRICNPDIRAGSYPCGSAPDDLEECKDLDHARADYKISKRHLDAEVETCELGKVIGSRGEMVY